MSILVKHLATENEYIFLGIELGGVKSSLSPRIFGDLFANEEGEKIGRVAVCDPGGKIRWFNASELVVIEVDGQIPSEMLPEIISPTTPEIITETSEDITDYSENEEEWI